MQNNNTSQLVPFVLYFHIQHIDCVPEESLLMYRRVTCHLISSKLINVLYDDKSSLIVSYYLQQGFLSLSHGEVTVIWT